MTQTLTSLVSALGAHPALAALIVFLACFAEALLIVGAVVPTTVLLVGVGTLIGLGSLPFLPLVVAGTLGAAAGDALGFWAGRHWQGRLDAVWPFRAYPSLMARGEGFVARHGGKSILVARFVPGVKAVVPILAGSMGMGVAWFSLVNVASGAVWVLAQVLPAVAVGRGLQVGGLANPRALLLAGLVAAAMLGAWLLARLASTWLVPWLDRARQHWAARLAGRTDARARRLRRLVVNEDGALVVLAAALLTLAALAGLLALTMGLLFCAELARSDAAIAGFVQSLRTPWATHVMLAVTMLGDGAVLIVVANLLVALLALYREWRLATVVAGAGLLGAAAVPLLKGLLHRARPIPLGDGAQAFSFPSGHSTLAAIVLGVLALFVARAAPARFRTSLYGAFAALVALIAFSRVYLQAHWPSDVAAGLLFGAAVAIVVALLLRTRTLAVPGRAFAILIGVLVLGVAPLHLWRGYAAAYALYDVPAPTVVLTQAEWLNGGWQALPQARVLLDGDAGEPMVLQTDLPLTTVADALEAAGWRLRTDSVGGEIVKAIVPARGDLMDRAPWPMTHLGRAPLATLVRPDPADPARRLVLRLWGTDRVVSRSAGPHLLIAGSLTVETLDPVALGWSLVETADEGSPPVVDLAAALPGIGRRPSPSLTLVAALGGTP